MSSILLTLNHFNDTSVNNLSLALANHLEKKDWKVYIFSLSKNGPLLERFKQNKNFKVIRKQGSLFRDLFLLSNLFFKDKIEIICSHHLISDYFLFLVRLLAFIKFRTKIQHLVIRHNYFFAPLINFRNILKNLAYFFSVNLVDYNFCVSVHLLNKIKKLSLLKRKSTLLVRNGVVVRKKMGANKKNQLRKKMDLPTDKKIILYTGVFSKRKSVETLIQALSLIKNDFFCILAGEGPTNAKLRDLVKEKNLNNKVIFTGFVGNVADYLDAADIFVLPSKSEGLSISLMEAMSSGLACVVSSCAGNTELIVNSKNGLVFGKSDQFNDLSRELGRLLEDESLLVKYGLEARKKIVSQFNQRAMLNNYENAFLKLMSK